MSTPSSSGCIFKCCGLSLCKPTAEFVKCMLILWVIWPALFIGMLAYLIPVCASRGRVSGVAYEFLFGRVCYHLEKTRQDEGAMQLTNGLPATNKVTMYLMVKPMLWMFEMSGYKPSWLQYPAPVPSNLTCIVAERSDVIDTELSSRITAGSPTWQVVILGAGWGTRAYGPLKSKGVKFFEVDKIGTQTQKKEALAKAGIDCSHVEFVAMDFEKDWDWKAELSKGGKFNPSLPTAVICEGVTYWMCVDAVEGIMKSMKGFSAPSFVVFDFLSTEYVATGFGFLSKAIVSIVYSEKIGFTLPIGKLASPATRSDASTVVKDFVTGFGLKCKKIELLPDKNSSMDFTDSRNRYGGVVVADC